MREEEGSWQREFRLHLFTLRGWLTPLGTSVHYVLHHTRALEELIRYKMQTFVQCATGWQTSIFAFQTAIFKFSEDYRYVSKLKPEGVSGIFGNLFLYTHRTG